MKNEVRGKISSEFVGVKSNIYSLFMVDNEGIKKAKGINKNVKSIMHKKYVDVLFSRVLVRQNMKRIESRLHRTGTYDVWKTSLSYFDDKRYILDDGVSSLAYFHKNVFG